MVLCPDTKPSLKGSHAKAQGNALGKRGPSSFISFFLLFSPERAARGMTWDRPSRPFRAKQIRKKRKKEGGCFSLPRALPVGCYVSALRAERIKALRPAAGEENGTVPRYQAEPERLARQSPGNALGERGPSSFISFFLLFSPERVRKAITAVRKVITAPWFVFRKSKTGIYYS